MYKTDLSTSVPSTVDNRDKIIIKHDAGSPQVSIAGAWTTKIYPYSSTETYITDQNSGKGSKSVTFNPTISTDGDYAVYLKWAAVSQTAGQKVLSTNAKKVPVDVVKDWSKSWTTMENGT